MPPDDRDQKSTLDIVYQIFPLTREILRKHGSGAGEIPKIAVPVRNQAIRPFAAKWHRLSLAKAFDDPSQRQQFRAEVAEIQKALRSYTRALGELEDVEGDLADLED